VNEQKDEAVYINSVLFRRDLSSSLPPDGTALVRVSASERRGDFPHVQLCRGVRRPCASDCVQRKGAGTRNVEPVPPPTLLHKMVIIDEKSNIPQYSGFQANKEVFQFDSPQIFKSYYLFLTWRIPRPVGHFFVSGVFWKAFFLAVFPKRRKWEKS